MFIDPEAALNKTDVKTNSRLVVSWLTAVRGYRVKLRTMQPRAGMFGTVKYTQMWLLEAPASAGNGRKQ